MDAKFLRFNQVWKDEPVLINADHIATVFPDDKGCLIALTNGKTYQCTDKFDAVEKILQTTHVTRYAGSGTGRSV